MKFFKHHVDAHTSTNLRIAMKKIGMHKAYACYFILVELCVAKWDHKEDDWERCVFRFQPDHLANILGTKREHSKNILRTFQECNLITFDDSENVCVIKMPNLLKFLDKDSKYDRKRVGKRSEFPTLDKEEDKEEEKEEERDSTAACAASLFLDFSNSLKEYPGRHGTRDAQGLCRKYVTTPAARTRFGLAIKNYATHVAENQIPARYVKHLTNFIKNWEEWADATPDKKSKWQEETFALLQRLQKESGKEC